MYLDSASVPRERFSLLVFIFLFFDYFTDNVTYSKMIEEPCKSVASAENFLLYL